MKEEIALLKNAYETYNLDIRENVSTDVLLYIRGRLIENKEFLEQLISVTKENITFSEIINAFDRAFKQKEAYKSEKKMKQNEYGFVSNIYTSSVGLIAVETYSPLYIIEYFVLAIKSRNVIAISDLEYEEESVKSAILIIFSEALKKFNIDANLINIIPFEECNYELFDKVIYADEKEIRELKKSTDEIFLYIENEFFNEIAEEEKKILEEEGENVRIIRNDFYDAIEKINKNNAFAACIYTKNPKLGYKFINLVKADNAFVNSSIYYSEKIEKNPNPLYKNKKIMYELGSIKEKRAESNTEENTSNEKEHTEKVSKFNENFEIKHTEEKEKIKNENEFRLVVVEESTPWYKRIFKKLIELKRRIMGESYWW